MRSPAVSLVAVAFVLLAVLSVEGRHHSRGHHQKGHHRNHDGGVKHNSHQHRKFHQKLGRDLRGQSLVADLPMTKRSSRNRRDDVSVTKPTSATIADNGSPGSSEKPEERMACSFKSDCTNITNSICETVTKTCICNGSLSVRIQSPASCVRPVALNATCDYEAQCLDAEEFSTCDAVRKICVCITGYEMKTYPDVGVNCVTKSGKIGGVNVDPAMIGVLAGLALMFVIICVVLRLFSKAAFRETRSIFNTPNPRLMNASLFKDSKLLSPARGDRRGSRTSVRGPPSRAPSVTSVNKEGRSPNGSLAKGRRGSVLSTASATGSAAAAAVKTPSPSHTEKTETTVAIEAVD